jgi:hypothetical protein
VNAPTACSWPGGGSRLKRHVPALLSPIPCSCIHVLDQDGQEQRRYGPLQQPVQHLAWAGDVLVAATSHTIHLWRQGGTEDEAEDGLVLHTPEAGSAVLQIATCPQGRWLAAACSDNEVRWVCPPDAYKRLLAYMQRGPQPVCAGALCCTAETSCRCSMLCSRCGVPPPAPRVAADIGAAIAGCRCAAGTWLPCSLRGTVRRCGCVVLKARLHAWLGTH